MAEKREANCGTDLRIHEQCYYPAKLVDEALKVGSCEIRQTTRRSVQLLYEDASHPVTPPEFAGSVTQRVPGTLEHTVTKRLEILRHEDNLAAAFKPDLVDKVGESGCGSEIQQSVWFETVTVATGYEQKVCGFAKLRNLQVFCAGAEAIELESVQKVSIFL